MILIQFNVIGNRNQTNSTFSLDISKHLYLIFKLKHCSIKLLFIDFIFVFCFLFFSIHFTISLNWTIMILIIVEIMIDLIWFDLLWWRWRVRGVYGRRSSGSCTWRWRKAWATATTRASAAGCGARRRTWRICCSTRSRCTWTAWRILPATPRRARTCSASEPGSSICSWRPVSTSTPPSWPRSTSISTPCSPYATRRWTRTGSTSTSTSSAIPALRNSPASGELLLSFLVISRVSLSYVS